MKALSLWQPWASAIALGLKRIETRHWATSHRGLLAIHAAKRWTAEERWAAKNFACMFGCDALRGDLPLGAIVAVATLVDVRSSDSLRPTLSDDEEELGNYAPGRFGWMLAGIVALPAPIPTKGMQGLFDLTGETTSAVIAAAYGR